MPKIVEHCAMCGGTPHQRRPERVGMSDAACPTCGSFRRDWRFARATDLALANRVGYVMWPHEQRRREAINTALNIAVAERMEPISDVYPRVPPAKERTQEDVPMSTIRSGSGRAALRRQEEAEWQADYERRTRGRVEAANQVDDFSAGVMTAQQVAVTRVELATDPQSDLIAQAREGDEYAVRRCDDLFGDSWRRQEKSRVA